MARIRSVHPGLFSDEAFVSCSAYARLLAIGLWTESDDKGVFEWKPVTLKMRLFPADSLDVVPLLDELSNADLIHKYEFDGKFYGAVRNFRKYQKPKTPNDVHPLPSNMNSYVGLKAISEIVPVKAKAFLPKGEKSFQMEDGGGKMENSPIHGERLSRVRSTHTRVNAYDIAKTGGEL